MSSFISSLVDSFLYHGRFHVDVMSVFKAAELGDADAQYTLGMAYTHALVVEKGEPGHQGHSEAQFNMDRLYGRRIGLEKEITRALVWFRRAAEQGHAEAQCELGLRCLYGYGPNVPQDEQRGLFWLHKAAEQGNVDAQECLGQVYEQGEYVPQDEQQAAVWYRQAAEQGDKSSQYYLGEMYFEGRGVPQDDQKASACYRQAAEQGHAGGGPHQHPARVQCPPRPARLWHQRTGPGT